jgi:hypothetical protein
MGHQRCCCGGDVLIWLGSQDPAAALPADPSWYATLKQTYEDMGLVVHFDADYTSISNYSLVFIDTPYSAPSWWATATGGGWTGRICIVGEFSPGAASPGVISWINSVSGATHGMTITAAIIDAIGLYDGTIETDALTAGLTTALLYGATSEVSGGTVLSKTEFTAQEWIHHNKVGTVDYVLSGDSNHLIDDPGGGGLTGITPGSDNERFAQNLYNVAV